MNRIFISYRRDDSVGYSGRLADQLSMAFGEDQVFRDYDDIGPGQNFVESIAGGLSSADVLLIVIGANWLTIKDESGQRRLDDEQDFVRLEIEAALNRNIHIIPLLVNDTPMPNTRELPPSLAAMALRQAIPLNDSRWNQDVANLITNIHKLTGLKQQAGRHLHRRWLYLSLFACGLAAVLISVYLRQTAFSGQWYFEDGDYLAITRQDEGFAIEHVDPAMQKVYGKGSARLDWLTLEFTLEPIYTDRFKYQGSLVKSWDGASLQGELLEILSDQRSPLLLKKRAEQ